MDCSLSLYGESWLEGQRRHYYQYHRYHKIRQHEHHLPVCIGWTNTVCSYLIGHRFSVALSQHEDMFLVHQLFRHQFTLLTNLSTTTTAAAATSTQTKRHIVQVIYIYITVYI